MKKVIFIIAVVLQISFLFCQDKGFDETIRFFGNENYSLDVGGIIQQNTQFNEKLSSYSKFPLIANFSFSSDDKLKALFWFGLNQNEFKKEAIYNNLFQMGAEYSHFFINDKTNALSIRLRHNLVQTNMLDVNRFYNFTSIIARYEMKLITLSSSDNSIGDIRAFFSIGSYYSYDRKIGGLSLLAGISIGNGIRISFDIGSFIFKNNNLYRYLGATALSY